MGLITDPDSPWQHLLYFYPYNGHGVGLDVHDVGDYGNFADGGRTLEPGMIFAVEPLLYVGENLIAAFRRNVTRRFSITEEEVDRFLDEVRPVFERYKGIAARIEDDVLITRDGNEVLSKDLPRSVEDIEKAMALGSHLRGQ
jgi:Xaa-Pro aminopeptidase